MSEGLKILIAAYEDPSPENFKNLVSVMAFDQSFATDQLAEERSRNALKHPEHLASWGSMMRSAPAFFALANRVQEITAPTMAKFSIRTGKALSLPATRDLSAYPVKVEGGQVLVDVSRE